MIGETIYTNGSYSEIVILEEDTVQLIMCIDIGDTGIFKLYRINAPEAPLLHDHACYTWQDVQKLFQRAIDFTVMNRAQEQYRIKMNAYRKAEEESKQ